MKRLFGNLVAIVALLSVAYTIADGAPLREAHVSQVVSDVKLLPEQAAPRPAAINDPVRDGTAVRTGTQSRSELTFTDQTITRLGANTIFSFQGGTRVMNYSGFGGTNPDNGIFGGLGANNPLPLNPHPTFGASTGGH